jgi:hypothetical protein
LAPHAAWRREIVPRPPLDPNTRAGKADSESKKGLCRQLKRGGAAIARGDALGGSTNRPREHSGRADESSRQPPSPGRTDEAVGADVELARALVTGAAAPGATSADVANLTPSILSVRHWSRLLGGLLYASSPRVRWPELLRRTFDVDVLECPKCHGRLRVIEVVVEQDAARRILNRLGLSVDAPRLVRARDPTTLDGDEPEAA